MIDFKINDVIHRIPVRFVRAYLPAAKKNYYLKAVDQPVLDIHGIASKAGVYDISASPKVIEEGLVAGMMLIYYLVADGYKIKTPLFNLGIRVPGEYDGSEAVLPGDVSPEASLRTSAEFRKYLKEKVKLGFGGVEDNGGCIAGAFDEASGTTDRVMTRGNILRISGYGLRIGSDPEHGDEAGVFFVPPSGKAVKAHLVPVNGRRLLKVFVPQELKAGVPYTLTVHTMCSPRDGRLIKTMRVISSGFTLTA